MTNNKEDKTLKSQVKFYRSLMDKLQKDTIGEVELDWANNITYDNYVIDKIIKRYNEMKIGLERLTILSMILFGVIFILFIGLIILLGGIL